MNNPTTDLSTATLEELIAEIHTRAACSIVIYTQDPKIPGEANTDGVHWAGPMSWCLGLVTRAQHRLLKRVDDDTLRDSA